jgi:hypothetical protein
MKDSRKIRRATCTCCGSARLIAGRASQGRRGVAHLTTPGRERVIHTFSQLNSICIAIRGSARVLVVGGHNFRTADVERVSDQID